MQLYQMGGRDWGVLYACVYIMRRRRELLSQAPGNPHGYRHTDMTVCGHALVASAHTQDQLVRLRDPATSAAIHHIMSSSVLFIISFKTLIL